MPSQVGLASQMNTNCHYFNNNDANRIPAVNKLTHLLNLLSYVLAVIVLVRGFGAID